MNWQDIFSIRSGGDTWIYGDGPYKIYYKDTNLQVPNHRGCFSIDEAFEAAQALFNRLVNELENFLLG